MARDRKPLGRMHLKWLRAIARTKNGRMGVSGYDGTPWGNALDGLVQRGLIRINTEFESGLGLYEITEAGRAAAQEGASNG